MIIAPATLKLKKDKLIMFFDTETTGLIFDEKNKKELRPLEQQPYITQLSYILFNPTTYEMKTIKNSYIKQPNPNTITPFITNITGITNEICATQGTDIKDALWEFYKDWQQCDKLIAHNIEFDIITITNEFLRNIDYFMEKDPQIQLFMRYRTEYAKKWNMREYKNLPKSVYCTMFSTMKFCDIKQKNGYGIKYPRLSELYVILFNEEPPQPLHNAVIDTLIGLRCYLKYKEDKTIHNEKFNRMIKDAFRLTNLDVSLLDANLREVR